MNAPAGIWDYALGQGILCRGGDPITAGKKSCDRISLRAVSALALMTLRHPPGAGAGTTCIVNKKSICAGLPPSLLKGRGLLPPHSARAVHLLPCSGAFSLCERGACPRIAQRGAHCRRILLAREAVTPAGWRRGMSDISALPKVSNMRCSSTPNSGAEDDDNVTVKNALTLEAIPALAA